MALAKEQLDEFVRQVTERTNLVEVVQAYVPLKRKGGRYWGCCPFHAEKTPSFSVVPDKGFFYCFGCHAGGNAFKFLSLIENISYFDAVKLQAEKLGIEMPRRPMTEAEERQAKERSDLEKVNALARTFFHNCLTMTKMGEMGRKYFAERGIGEATIEAFSLGFSPPAWGRLSEAFLKRGIPEELLLSAGLSAERKNGGLYDRFRARVMIPILDEHGRVVGFGGRVLDDSLPKYINTPETVLFNKRMLLFGLDRARRAIKREGFAIIVEGYMDAISVYGAGVENVVATLGTSFTEQHAKKLMRYTGKLVFCYDSDEAGQRATVRALGILQNTGAQVKVFRVPDGKDPDAFIRKNGAEAFRTLAKGAMSLIDYRMDYVLSHTRYDTLDGKVQALKEIAPVLRPLRDGAKRTEYIRRVAGELMLDEGVVADELRRGSSISSERTSVRQAVHRMDSAVTKAGRIIFHLAAKDAAAIVVADAAVPLGEVLSGVQHEIYQAFLACEKKGETQSLERIEARLSDAAAAELSRAVIDTSLFGGGIREGEAFEEAIRTLRKVYLNQQYMLHSQQAEKYLQAGNPAYRVELKEADRIKREMEELEH